ncbi:MAG: IS1634 family transposase [Bacteroidales bacterium]
MAFLRKERKDTGTYIRIVQSYRDEQGKSRHRTLYNLGKIEDYEPAALKKIGQTLYELGGGTLEEMEQRQLHELGRFYYGFPMIVRRLLTIYSLDTFLNGITRNKSLGFSMLESVILLISERLHDPVSKLSNYNNQSDYIGIEQMELHQIYRTLDYLYESQEPIKRMIYSKGRNLFNQKLDVVFYDVTTFYFDSDKEDGFREKGFGKDGKIGNTIVTFGLLIDQNKQPVGYEVYQGKQYEGHTFTDALGRLKEKYQIEKVICVADTGMMNQDNILEVGQNGYEFIFGERLKNLEQGIQNEILNREYYQILTMDDVDSNDKIEIQYYVTGYKNRKLITTYSTKRAAKDKAEREEKVKKAQAFINNPSALAKKARTYFLKKEGKDQYSLDLEKIQKSERFDGFLCIATNNQELSVQEILQAYKQLYKVEHSFRSFKSFLETRPMFHWTEARILGHLALCYISFTLLNYLQLQLKTKATPQSENQIRKSLVKMQMSLVAQNGKEYYLRSKTEQGAKQIMNALSIKEIPDFIPQRAINQYL